MDVADVTKVFRHLAPEFSGIDEHVIATWIALTEPFVNRKKFRNTWTQALALLIAHRMKMANVGNDPDEDSLAEIAGLGVGGITRINSYHEGETTIGFNTNIMQYMGTNAEYALTQYGIQYLSMMRLVSPTILSSGQSILR